MKWYMYIFGLHYHEVNLFHAEYHHFSYFLEMFGLKKENFVIIEQK